MTPEEEMTKNCYANSKERQQYLIESLMVSHKINYSILLEKIMKVRSLFLFLASLMMANYAVGAPVPTDRGASGPPVTFQLAPGKKLISDVTKIVNFVAGEGFGGLIDGQIKGKLGEKGFTGLDMTKPVVGWLNLPNKAIKDLEDAKDFNGVVAIPVTGEQDFKDFLVRLSPENDPLTLEPVAGNTGLYVVKTNDGEAPIPIRARFHDGHFFVGINAPDSVLDVKNLPLVKSLVIPDDPGMLLIRIFTSRYPEKMMDQSSQLEDLKQQLENLPAYGEFARSLMDSYVAMMNRMSAQMKNTEESGFRVVLDEKSAEIAMESYAIPKAGSTYAAEIAAVKPTMNRFGSLVSDQTAVGGMVQLPIFAPELRDIINKLIAEGEKNIDEGEEFIQPVMRELLTGIKRTIKADAIDFAATVNESKTAGKFNAIAAVTFDDATGLEKALKAAMKNAPKDVVDHVKFDVDTIDKVSVHRVTSEEGEANAAKQIFGAAEFYFAFGPKGIYFAMGPDWKESLQAAMTAKAVPAKVFEIAGSPMRLGSFITAVNEDAGSMIAPALGKDERRVSILSISYEGGSTMKMRMAMNLKVVPKLVMSWFTTSIVN